MGTSVQNFFTSRDNNVDPATYVGQLDRLWYNPDTNQIFISDGVTPGGQPVDLGANANAVINNLTVNSIGTGDSSAIDFRTDARFTQGATIDVGLDVFGTLAIDGNLNVTGNISPAAEGKIGGIIPGPGANISNTGLLTIDTTGLPLSFGNFTANNNILTIVNSDENMILATQGSAEIQLVGNVGFYKTNGLPPDISNRYFEASDDGQVKFFVPNTDPLLGAVEIIGSASLQTVSPAVAGVMLHITGQPSQAASQYIDGIGSNPNYIGRRYNGNAVSPTQVLSGQTIVRFSGQGYSTGGFNAPADGTISLDALEDFTQTNQGAIWRFLVNPVGGNVRQEVANISVANGVTATKFTTSDGVTATGNISGGNLLTTGLISATGNITGGNVAGTLITGTLATAAQPNVTSVGTLTSLTVTGNVSGGNLITGGLLSVTGNISGGNLAVSGTAAITGNASAGNLSATNYTGLVTHAVRDAGDVDGGTVTLNMTTDNIVKCTFDTNGMTVAFSNIIPGRIVTLLAEKTDGTTDNINTGIASTNMSNGDNTSPVNGPCTAVLTYYSLGTTTADIYCQIVSAT